jgi:hypothetical protein
MLVEHGFVDLRGVGKATHPQLTDPRVGGRRDAHQAGAILFFFVTVAYEAFGNCDASPPPPLLGVTGSSSSMTSFTRGNPIA